MSWYQVVGWFILAAGACAALFDGLPLIGQVARSGKHQVSKPATRRRAWHQVRLDLYLAVTGVSMAGEWWHHRLLLLVPGTYAIAIAVWEIRLRLRSRSGAKPGGLPAGPP
jgi:hypothetical protein